MTKIRACGNIARCPLECLWIEPELACRIRQPSIQQTIGSYWIAIAACVQIVQPLRRRPWESGAEGNDSVRLPPFEQNPRDSVKRLAKGNVPYEVDDRVVRQVE